VEFGGLGIRTRSQFREHINDVIENPTSKIYYSDGREVFLHEASGTVVIKRFDGHPSTAFRPENWSECISSRIPRRTQPPQPISQTGQ